MGQLVSKEFYQETFKGKIIVVDDQDRILQIAELQLNDLTRNKISSDLVDPILTKVKLAICYQADYFYQNGGDMGNVQSFSVDGISVSYQSGGSASKISETAHLLIKTTGLLSRIL